MQIELHLGSLALGAFVGTVMSLLGAFAIGPALFPRSASYNTVFLETMKRCDAKQPIYASRIGEMESVKCNGHREGKEP